jgi:AcrR family transcriptional regulator
MVLTPWGDSSELRERMLRPGRGTPPEEAERNQRERLFAAIVATVAEKGYEATTVADLVKLSGVSGSAFYRYFEDKQACFLAAIESLVEPALAIVSGPEPAADQAAGRRAFEALIEAIARQEAAAKMCFVEVYAAWPEGMALVDRTMDAFEELVGGLLERTPGHQGTPSWLVRAIVGGVQKVIHKRLYRDQASELPGLAPELWQWVFSCPPPPGALKAPRRRAPRTPSFEERQAFSNPPERILRALAEMASEKGLAEVVAEEVSKRASTSNRAFYRNFANKQAALVAALDSGYSQLLAAALPAFRRATDWPHAMRDMIEAMLASAVAEPEYPQLTYVAVYGNGQSALERREASAEGLEGLLARGYELKPDALPIASEAIIAAVFALIDDQVKAKGLGGLLALVPAATYLILAPFLGAEEAYAVAVS